MAVSSMCANRLRISPCASSRGSGERRPRQRAREVAQLRVSWRVIAKDEAKPIGRDLPTRKEPHQAPASEIDVHEVPRQDADSGAFEEPPSQGADAAEMLVLAEAPRLVGRRAILKVAEQRQRGVAVEQRVPVRIGGAAKRCGAQ